MEAVAEAVGAKPKLRFAQFSEPWRSQSLEAVATFHDEKRVPIKEGDRSKRRGQYPYYGASGIIDYVDDFLFDGEYILLGEDGANIVLRNSPLAFVVSGKFWVNNHAHVIEANGSNHFLAEALELINYEQYNTGTAQPKLNAAVCKRIKLNLPTLPEQQKIAAFLGAVDRKIQQLKRKQELLEQYKKGVVQQLFSQELRFKRKDGGAFPQWEEKRLGDLLKFQVGSPFSSSYFNDQGIGLRLVKNRDLKSDDQPYHFNGPYEDHYLVSDGDILIGMDGDFLPCRWKKGPALLNQRVGRILVTGSADKEFLYFYLFKELEAIQHRTASTTVKHLSHTDVENIVGLLPSLEEQSHIAGFLEALDAKVEGVAQAVAAAQKWKKGLLQQMFV